MSHELQRTEIEFRLLGREARHDLLSSILSISFSLSTTEVAPRMTASVVESIVRRILPWDSQRKV